MKRTGMRCFRLKPGFLRKEDGAATIEAVLWLPFFLLLFAALADISMIFFGQTRVMRIAQDANRNMSIGRFDTTDETEQFVIDNLGGFAPNATVETTVVAGLISTSVSVPLVDLEIFGVAEVFSDASLTVQTNHLMEY